ncbi:SH3-domain-containing protein [Calocera viscosa TUFC12733]|uniref:SH3-domain-containing protein n=1 Tax=Calocera viscosa (strain TUFC12733) TaxID=1330018 RepID=A0A167KG51_CALVF|nr:SH3-domain-containing protein [Calocera viscosa TUFC12733]
MTQDLIFPLPASAEQPTFVRALYDYSATDAACLAFRKGDVIELLERMESGWWDGLLNGERGWFPSNYVEVLPNGEEGQ